MITALQLLRSADAMGWSFKVDQGDDEGPIAADSAIKAWNMVKDVGEARVDFIDEDGSRAGWAYLMAPGPMTCSDDETLVDFSCDGGRFEAMCDAALEG